jgi:hypothetical protein
VYRLLRHDRPVEELSWVRLQLRVSQRLDSPAVLRSIPRLDKGSLCLVRVLFCADFLDSDLGAVLGEDDVLLLQLVHAALGEFVGVEEHLSAPKSASYSGTVEPRAREAYLIAYPGDTAHDGEQHHQWYQVPCAHRLCLSYDVVGYADDAVVVGICGANL